MGMHSLGIRTTVTTIAAACAEFRVPSGNRVAVREITITLAAATASVYGLGRPAAVGVTPTSPISILPLDPQELPSPGVTQSAVAWGTAPTVPAQFLRRMALAAAIGNGDRWLWGPNEFFIGPVGAAAIASIVIWNVTANSAATDITIMTDE